MKTINEYEKAILMKFWKKGVFHWKDLVDICRNTKKRQNYVIHLERLKIIKKEGDVYSIDRARYLEITKEDKQEKLELNKEENTKNGR